MHHTCGFSRSVMSSTNSFTFENWLEGCDCGRFMASLFIEWFELAVEICSCLSFIHLRIICSRRVPFTCCDCSPPNPWTSCYLLSELDIFFRCGLVVVTFRNSFSEDSSSEELLYFLSSSWIIRVYSYKALSYSYRLIVDAFSNTICSEVPILASSELRSWSAGISTKWVLHFSDCSKSWLDVPLLSMLWIFSVISSPNHHLFHRGKRR